MVDKATQFEQEIAYGLDSFFRKEYADAIKYFEKARDLAHKKLKDRRLEARAEGYLQLCEGMQLRDMGDQDSKNRLEAMKAFGRSTGFFSGGGWTEETQQARIQQAEVQMEIARHSAKDNALLESARMYETAALTYQMAGQEKESHQARARSLVQQAALASNDFEKADMLQNAVGEFKQAQESPLIIEGHALFYRGRSLTTVKPNEAVDCLKRAYESYKNAGATEQANKVVEELKRLKEEIEKHPSEYERRRTLMR